MGNIFSLEQLPTSQGFIVTPLNQSFDESSILPIISSLEENAQKITSISIANQSYTEEALSLLANTIQECQNITSADFSSIIPNSESPEILEILNSTLLCLRNLYEVNLSKNNLVEDAIYILSFLFHSENLKVLKINDNHLGIEGAVKLSESFRNSELQLYVFCADRNCFEDQGIMELAEAFSSMKSLRQLSLSDNRMGKEGIAAVCKSLMNNIKLQVLEICDCYANEEQAYSAISCLVEKLVFLSVLALSDCFLGNYGAKSVLSALVNSNENLAELKIAYNEIDDDEVAEILVKVLKTKRLLEYVEIGGNDFSQRMMEKILDAGEFFVKDQFFINVYESESDEDDLFNK